MSTLAIVHPTDLLGVELRESLERRRDLWDEMRLLSTLEDEIGSLTEVRGEAAMVTKIEAGSLSGVDVAFFSAEMGANHSLLSQVPEATAAVLLSPDAGANDGLPIVAGVNLDRATRETTLVSPHPATVLLAHLLYPLRGFDLGRVAATVLQPVSMVGKAGLDEMLGQTRSILSFDNDPPRDIFPFQMVFNTVPATTSKSSLEQQLGTVLDSPASVSIDLLQAGIFHGFGASVYIELGEDPGPDTVRRALAEHPVNELSDSPETLGPIDAAASDKVLVGNVEAVNEGEGCYRVWAVMDNLTCGGAANAIQILEAISSQVMH
ncbi:MAG: Asd/ArgC dimerization domain-containing protein [Acidobacteriota bacterium]